jgi:hypothetical protein
MCRAWLHAHLIDSAAIDVGTVICENLILGRPKTRWLENVLRLYDAGCASLVETIEALVHDQVPKTVGPLESERYFSFPTERDINRFEEAGHQ